MIATVNDHLDYFKIDTNISNNVDFRVVEPRTRDGINRGKKVETRNFRTWAKSIPPATRLATVCNELRRRIGGQINADIEVWVAGKKVDGRLALKNLPRRTYP